MRFLSLLAVSLCFAADKDRKPATGQYSNDAIEISATLYNEKESIQRLLGSDLSGAVVVVEVRLVPKGEGELAVNRDDFWLRSDKDGQKSQPFAPSQIAGSATLVVSSTGGGRGVMGDQGGPIWGGIGGRPRRLGGDGAAIGNASESSAQATAQTDPKAKDNPLLAVLKEKVLPEKKISEPLSGLLYFQMEGKHKTKELELNYRGPAGKFSLRFK